MTCRQMRSVFLVLISLAPFSATAQRARKTKTGVPCGNSYISADKTCHVGATTTPRDTAKSSAYISPASAFGQAQSVAQPITGTLTSLYTEFAASLRPWLMKRVIVRNSGADERALQGAALSEIRSDHIVLVAAGNHFWIPFGSIEMAYSDQPASLSDAALTLVMRR